MSLNEQFDIFDGVVVFSSSSEQSNSNQTFYKQTISNQRITKKNIGNFSKEENEELIHLLMFYNGDLDKSADNATLSLGKGRNKKAILKRLNFHSSNISSYEIDDVVESPNKKRKIENVIETNILQKQVINKKVEIQLKENDINEERIEQSKEDFDTQQLNSILKKFNKKLDIKLKEKISSIEIILRKRDEDLVLLDNRLFAIEKTLQIQRDECDRYKTYISSLTYRIPNNT